MFSRCTAGIQALWCNLKPTIDWPPLSQWNASQAVTLWWKDKQQRQVADKRVTVKPTSSSSVVELEIDHFSEDEFDLEDFIAW